MITERQNEINEYYNHSTEEFCCDYTFDYLFFRM